MANKKYNQIDPQVSKWTYIIILSVFILIIGLIIGLQPSNSRKVYDAYKNVASSDFTEDHPFYEIGYRDRFLNKGLESVLEQEKFVILYVGYNQCQSCINHIGAFQRYFYSEGLDAFVDHVYYLNVANNLNDFQAFIDNVSGAKEETPQLVLFIDGQMVQSFVVQSADNTETINSSVRQFFQGAKSRIENA